VSEPSSEPSSLPETPQAPSVGPPLSSTQPLPPPAESQSEVAQPEVVPPAMSVTPVTPSTRSSPSSPSSSDRFFCDEDPDSDTTPEQATPSSQNSVTGLTPSSMLSTPSSSVNGRLRASRAKPHHGMVRGVGRGTESYSTLFLFHTPRFAFDLLTPTVPSISSHETCGANGN
jgi:hypothetical protein